MRRLRLLALVTSASGILFAIHCGSSDGPGADTEAEGGASSTSSGASGFTPTTCDGAPCPAGDSGDPLNPGASCGDGDLARTEACDDGNKGSGDGCSASCALEPGWTCPTPGIACVAAKCGDGILAGVEECEFTTPDGAPPTGCTADCKIAPGYDCNPTTFECKPVVCGDGVISRGETCEDGNDLPFDGCFNCQKDPVCSNGSCQATCGDGQRFANEECDDGNTRSGDGCSADCKREVGYACTDVAVGGVVSDLPVLVRDFIGQDLQNDAASGVPHPDFNRRGGSGILGIVEPNLDANGRMVLRCPGGDCTQNPGYAAPPWPPWPNITTRANFDEWYRNNAKNIPSLLTLRLKQVGGAYVWDSADITQNPNANADPTFFDPIGGGGWVDAGKEVLADCTPKRNSSWTTETHFFFEYQGGEEFSFSGDDDTWVFVNGRLALDLGGLHTPRSGTLRLAAPPPGDAGVADGGATFSSDMPGNPSGSLDLGLQPGGIYEIAMFQAERNQCGSNFKVTFRGFNRPKSVCKSECGDGVRASDEVCDDGKNDGSYGGCMPGCLARGPRCGDGIKNGPEQCDDGNSVNDDACTNGCKSFQVN